MEDKVICPRCGDEISLTGTHRCVEHPAPGAVKVDLLPCPFCHATLQIGFGYTTTATHPGGPCYLANRMVTREECEAWNTRATPPATDVALRDTRGLPDRLHQLADNIVAGETVYSDHVYDGLIEAADAIVEYRRNLVAALSAPTPPDQPQIGDEVVERMKYLLDASPDDYWTKITTEVKAAGNQVRHACLLNHEAAHLLAWAEIARNAAIARAAIAAMPKGDALIDKCIAKIRALQGGAGSEFDVGLDCGLENAIAAIEALRDRRAK